MTRRATPRNAPSHAQDVEGGDELQRRSTAPCVSALRDAVNAWRENRYSGTTETTQRLLEYWFLANHRLASGEGFAWYAAQREAIETLIFLWECDRVRDQQTLYERYAREQPHVASLAGNWARFAIKMATGSGKTKVMSLAIVWQFMNAICEEPSYACQYASTFLLLAPNVIVFERLKTDFGSGRIFYTDPLIPPEMKSLWEFVVVERGEGHRPLPRGVLFLTNIQQMYERPQAAEESEPIAAMLGPKLSTKRSDASNFNEQISSRNGLLMVLNDEAHHAYDSTTWHQTLVRMNDRIKISTQVDFSATPRMPHSGALFPWTIYDYPLRRAIQDGVVKRPVRGIAKVAEADSGSAAIRYSGYLAAGVERWKEYCSQLVPLGKRPILFVMVTSTDEADDVAVWLRSTYPDLAGDKTLVIHTNSEGDITKDDQEAARKLAREVDDERSPVRAVVSVLMLREGWDVSNVTVVVGLRPFTARANILPEQAIGRGLRRMFRSPGTAIDERVDIIGTPGVMKLLDQLEQEEFFSLETVDLEKNQVSIRAIEPLTARSAYDVSIPVLSARYVHTNTITQKIESFDLSTLPLEHLDTIASRMSGGRFAYEAYDFLTGLKEFEREYPLPDELAPRDVIAFCARRIAEKIHAPSQFSVLAAQVKKFYERHAFRRTISIDESSVRNLLCNPATAYVTVNIFASALRARLTVEAHPELVAEKRLFSLCPPFPWSKAISYARKTVFNGVACDSEEQGRFVAWLDTLEDVAAFARIPPTLGFSLQYLDRDNRLIYFVPDFVIRDRSGTHLLVEFGTGDPSALHPKDTSIQSWCDAATKITGLRWIYIKLFKYDLDRLHSASLKDLEFLHQGRQRRSPPAAHQTVNGNSASGAESVELDVQDRHFLDEVYGLVACGKARKAITRIFDVIDDYILEVRYDRCAHILRAVDLERLEPTTAIGFLSITYQARVQIGKDRDDLLGRVEEYLRRSRDPEYVAALLVGLR